MESRIFPSDRREGAKKGAMGGIAAESLEGGVGGARGSHSPAAIYEGLEGGGGAAAKKKPKRKNARPDPGGKTNTRE